MSDIKVGDLVVVARACCPYTEPPLGLIFRAEEYRPLFNDGLTRCCKRHMPGPYFHDGYPGGWSAWYLKRIPPLDELESLKETHKLDVREPA